MNKLAVHVPVHADVDFEDIYNTFAFILYLVENFNSTFLLFVSAHRMIALWVLSCICFDQSAL